MILHEFSIRPQGIAFFECLGFLAMQINLTGSQGHLKKELIV